VCSADPPVQCERWCQVITPEHRGQVALPVGETLPLDEAAHVVSRVRMKGIDDLPETLAAGARDHGSALVRVLVEKSLEGPVGLEDSARRSSHSISLNCVVPRWERHPDWVRLSASPVSGGASNVNAHSAVVAGPPRG
jgi:hypothetical protein